ncbi:MAG: SufD family Fe-S cluster assembly protein [Candidatus Verstraetearchaeota archaeon]|nr:SufD family Fe-S cluster assembly protein [Candidatus Verstraetearchaeota archaeon]
MGEEWRKKYKLEALQAVTKRAAFGNDIDLSDFVTVPSREGELTDEVAKKTLEVGVDLGAKKTGTYFQLDHSVLLSQIASKVKGVEMMPTDEALDKYDWLKNYYWKALSVSQDKYTAVAELRQTKGYFIRSAPNTKVDQPIQACLYIGSEGLLQAPHNIVIAEEGSELNIVTGCTADSRARMVAHIGVSEFYVKKGATLIFTMIHSWSEDAYVRPRTGVIVEEGGTFISNYVLIKPVKDIQSYPTAHLVGKGAKAKFNSIIYASKDSIIDLGNRIYLMAEGTSGESVFKVVSTGTSKVYNRGQVFGQNRGTKGHLDCRGMILCPTSTITAIPELVAEHSETELSHEAAIGRLQEEQLHYLMSRGISPEQAIGVLVKGFLDPGLPGLPERLQEEIRSKLSLLDRRSEGGAKEPC